MTYAVIDTNVIVASLLTHNFFEVAIAGQETYALNLVTGNLKDYPKETFVVSPSEFCEIVGL